ncbi:penicillin-binding transpeptidase domain-containing protein, partial [Georgenia sp. 10Sc9-8]|nr:penicillin-binding transpeptidase domain-containing protein [Georgenia halotolerans]
YYTGTTTSYVGKFREAILAIKIDQSESKDTVLENYLNTIYFGRGTYGIERAAQAYFDKPAAELSISEAALLAGVIPSPSNWDPAVDRERAEERWTRVLGLMVEDGWITAEEREAAEFPDVADPDASERYAGPTGYVLDSVRTEVIDAAGISALEIDTQGLSIVTTIEEDAQEAAVAAVDDLPEDRPENNRTGMVSIDPETGGIVAMYGGADFITQSRNAATQDRAQAGSTFKPFALAAAMEQGMTLWETYPSYSPMEIEGYGAPVRNFDGLDRGWIDLVEATVNSVNTVYAQLNVDVGPENTMDVAVRAGIPEDTPGLVPTASNVLGPASPRVIDMASAYATFASGGIYHEPFLVAEVRDSDDNVRYTGGEEGERVFEAEVVADVTYAMTQVVDRGTGVRADLDRPTAGKTGSSNEYRSAWFAGFVPQLATAVAMYQVGEDGGEEVLTGFGRYPDDISGSTYPAELWNAYMSVATEDMEVEEFPERTAWRPRTYQPPVRPQPTEPQPVQPAPAPAPPQEPTEEAGQPEPEGTTTEDQDQDGGDGEQPEANGGSGDGEGGQSEPDGSDEGEQGDQSEGPEQGEQADPDGSGAGDQSGDESQDPPGESGGETAAPPGDSRGERSDRRSRNPDDGDGESDDPVPPPDPEPGPPSTPAPGSEEPAPDDGEPAPG